MAKQNHIEITLEVGQVIDEIRTGIHTVMMYSDRRDIVVSIPRYYQAAMAIQMQSLYGNDGNPTVHVKGHRLSQIWDCEIIPGYESKIVIFHLDHAIYDDMASYEIQI